MLATALTCSLGEMDQEHSAEWAERVVDQLRSVGVEFTAGLSNPEFDEAAEVFGSEIPAEFRHLLRVATPVSPKWARWADGPQKVFNDARDWINRAFEFDILHNQYWHSTFGERPAGNAEAIERALRVVHDAPPLVPIYSHRFLATAPAAGSRAVLSVWQAIDSIFYGNDLADYLAREFGIERPSWATPNEPAVPVWEDLFDLFCVGLDESE